MTNVLLLDQLLRMNIDLTVLKVGQRSVEVDLQRIVNLVIVLEGIERFEPIDLLILRIDDDQVGMLVSRLDLLSFHLLLAHLDDHSDQSLDFRIVVQLDWLGASTDVKLLTSLEFLFDLFCH